jgi:hypothetical protein
MKVLCMNAGLCKEKMCLHQTVHDHDHDKGFADAHKYDCSKYKSFCPIIKYCTMCLPTGRK